MKTPHKFLKRWFLNNPEYNGLAAIRVGVSATVEQYRRDDSPHPELDIVFELSDCSRVVSLDFSTWEKMPEEELLNVYRKVHILRDAVDEFAEEALTALDWYDSVREGPSDAA